MFKGIGIDKPIRWYVYADFRNHVDIKGPGVKGKVRVVIIADEFVKFVRMPGKVKNYLECEQNFPILRIEPITAENKERQRDDHKKIQHRFHKG